MRRGGLGADVVAGDQDDAAVPFEQAQLNLFRVVAFGGGGHGKTVIDLIRAAGLYRIVGIVDELNVPKERPK